MSEGQEQCIFCLIAQNKIQSAKIYDDNEITAFLDIRPASEGHVQVISKAHAPILSALPKEVSCKMLTIALSIGGGMVQKLGATGVTYLINEGQGANQKIAHASINVIPRYEGDTVSIGWEEKQMSQEEVSKYLQNVIKKLQSEKPVEKEEKIIIEEEPEIEESNITVKERVPKYW